MAFSHLHVHTEYSILDGMSTVPELLNRAQELKLSGIAITDHGTMTGAKEFHSMAKRFAPDVKPIIGDEVYVTDGYDHRIKDEDNRRTFHLILLAKNLDGYRNLCKISSIGAIEGSFRGKARVSLDVIREYHEGLICLSACIGGEVPSCILDEDLESAEEVINTYKEIFGEDYYLEVSEHPNERSGNPQKVHQWQQQTTAALLELGRKLGIKVVATNDSHFTYKEQAEAHDVMLAMNCGKTVSDPTRLRFTGEEYLKSEDEMLAIFKDHPEVVWNTREVCDKVEFYELDDSMTTPCPPICAFNENPDNALARLVKDGYNQRYDNNSEALLRVNYELSIIKKYGYANLFLIWYDLVQFARKENIMLGPGRGMASGSIVNYCLGITSVEPLTNGLLFERFINPESNRFYPMADFDVEYGAVGKVWDYLRDRYGSDRVAGIISYDKPKLKEVFSRVATAMEITPMVIEDILPELEYVEETYTLKQKMFRNPSLRKAYDIAKVLEGRKFARTTNPCGLFLSNTPISDMCPVCTGRSFFDDSEIPLAQYEWKDAEDIGYMRLNILSLKQLNVIKDTLNEIKDVTIDDCIYDDKVAALFHSGDTEGVFLFETGHVSELLRKVRRKPEETDILAINALHRPGLLDLIPDYQRNAVVVYERTGLKEYDDIVEETNGVLIYQEQCVRFFERFLNYSLGKAARMFRSLIRLRENDIRQIQSDFRKECRDRGVKEKVGDSVWRIIRDDCRCIMSKSHLLCYVRISVICAYLKAHYRDIYMKYNTQYGYNEQKL